MTAEVVGVASSDDELLELTEKELKSLQLSWKLQGASEEAERWLIAAIARLHKAIKDEVDSQWTRWVSVVFSSTSIVAEYHGLTAPRYALIEGPRTNKWHLTITT